jgi:hypothetical protein
LWPGCDDPRIDRRCLRPSVPLGFAVAAALECGAKRS